MNFIQNINFQNISISYSDTGKGKAVVLLHGFLENKTIWNFFVSEWSKKYRVIVPDLLGHGQTDSLGNLHTMEQQAEMIDFLLLKLKITKAIFVGHSMGGYVALTFAQIYPQKIIGLALVNSTAKDDDDERKKNRERAVTLVNYDLNNFIKLGIPSLFAKNNQNLFKSEIKTLINQALKTPLQGVLAAILGMKIRQNRLDFFQNSKLPKILILGKNDPLLNCEANLKLIENTNVQSIVLNGGHISMIEDKEGLKKSLSNFFDKL